MEVASSRTNGFLFADLRDYTRYVEAHGDRAAAALLDEYRRLVRAAVAEFGGAEIKTEGDSFYVVFPSASSAVQCGLALLRAAREHGRESQAPLRVGVGVHAGETVATQEGYVGSAVNMAARVCSQARAGELLVTDTVRSLTRTLLPVRFVDKRTRKLKGISEPVTLYRVVAGDEAASDTWDLTPGGAFGRIGRAARVAVLLTGLLIGGAAAGYLLLAAQRPPLDPADSPAPTAAATFPTAAERALVESIPLAIRDYCARTTEAAERLGTTASIRCDLDVAAAADAVWYDRFETDQQLAAEFNEIRLRERAPFGDCSASVSRAAGNWSSAAHAGSLMCFQSETATWIIWTYRADRILARASRSGTAAEDWTDLYSWWDDIKLFQR